MGGGASKQTASGPGRPGEKKASAASASQPAPIKRRDSVEDLVSQIEKEEEKKISDPKAISLHQPSSPNARMSRSPSPVPSRPSSAPSEDSPRHALLRNRSRAHSPAQSPSVGNSGNDLPALASSPSPMLPRNGLPVAGSQQNNSSLEVGRAHWSPSPSSNNWSNNNDNIPHVKNALYRPPALEQQPSSSPTPSAALSPINQYGNQNFSSPIKSHSSNFDDDMMLGSPSSTSDFLDQSSSFAFHNNDYNNHSDDGGSFSSYGGDADPLAKTAVLVVPQGAMAGAHVGLDIEKFREWNSKRAQHVKPSSIAEPEISYGKPSSIKSNNDVGIRSSSMSHQLDGSVFDSVEEDLMNDILKGT